MHPAGMNMVKYHLFIFPQCIYLTIACGKMNEFLILASCKRMYRKGFISFRLSVLRILDQFAHADFVSLEIFFPDQTQKKRQGHRRQQSYRKERRIGVKERRAHNKILQDSVQKQRGTLDFSFRWSSDSILFTKYGCSMFTLAQLSFLFPVLFFLCVQEERMKGVWIVISGWVRMRHLFC